MTTESEEDARAEDASLVIAVRQGDSAAYGELYRRHVASAYHLARQLCRGPAQVDDLVAEAFVRVLDALRSTSGPRWDSAFRAYLLTVVRHLAYDETRRNRRIELAEDVTTVSGVRADSVSALFTDTVLAAFDRHLAATAFRGLPARWKAVLWHTEVEGMSPAEIAPYLAPTPNGVSSLAYRARQTLRAAYLQAQMCETNVDRPCRSTFARLGVWAHNSLPPKYTSEVDSHLKVCGRCRRRVRQLAETNPATLVRRQCSGRIEHRGSRAERKRGSGAS